MATLLTEDIKIGCIISSFLLLAIGAFYGGGLQHVSGMTQNVDVSLLIKDIFPVLFLLPLVLLIGLGIIDLLAIQKTVNRKILSILSGLVLIDAIFAFCLNVLITGLVLLIPTLIFMLGAWKSGAPNP